MEEVIGSNPIRSTKSPQTSFRPKLLPARANQFANARDHTNLPRADVVAETYTQIQGKGLEKIFQQGSGIRDLGPLLFGGKARRVPTSRLKCPQYTLKFSRNTNN